MIQNTIRQQEGQDPSCEAAFLPKMTRSKVKEVLEKGDVSVINYVVGFYLFINTISLLNLCNKVALNFMLLDA